MDRFFLALFLVSLALAACEKEFIPDIPLEEPELVVEGYIEAGDEPRPPYVFLTRSVPFFQEINSEQLNAIFVRNADVFVREGDREIKLTEVCLQDLTPEQRELAQAFFGLSTVDSNLNFCVYLDVTFSFLGEVGKTYELEVRVEDKVLTAQTTITPCVPLDSLRFRQPPGEPSDTLRELEVFLRDPPGQRDFYRYFTQINSEPQRSPFNSVFTDDLFDGQEFRFPLPRAEAPDVEFDPKTYGLYLLGDTVQVKWTTINEAHYNFWNTLEFNRANQGPFSSYTLIDNNIDGGLGIWGGYSAKYYDLIVED